MYIFKLIMVLFLALLAGCSPRVHYREVDRSLRRSPTPYGQVKVLTAIPHDSSFKKVAVAYITVPGYQQEVDKKPLLKGLARLGCSHVVFLGNGRASIVGYSASAYSYGGVTYVSGGPSSEKHIFAYGYIKEEDPTQ